jgi:hypothetical protein
VRSGEPFRRAYRDVAARVKRGERVAELPVAALLAARATPGGLGNLPLAALRKRGREAGRWNARQRRRFDAALDTLVRGKAR